MSAEAPVKEKVSFHHLSQGFLHSCSRAGTHPQDHLSRRHAFPHLLGMTLLVIGHIVLLMQMALFLPFALPFPRGNTYLIYETVSDFAGLALLIGIFMALFRRLVLKPSHLESRWDDIYALIMLALIPLMGYINGALRLTATAPDWASASPIENMVAGWFQGARYDTSTGQQPAPAHGHPAPIHRVNPSGLHPLSPNSATWSPLR